MSCACTPPLFHRKEVPPYLHEPYINAGYRKSESTLLEAVKYVFTPGNNECLNFWTHFVPFVAWLTWFWLISFRIDFSDPYFYPLVCLWVGSCTYSFFSSMAHMLGCMGEMISRVCFFVDYMGISMYTLGLSLATFFYEFPTDSLYFRYKWLWLVTLGVLCVSSTVMTGLSALYGDKWQFFLKAGAYALPFTIASAPAWLRIALCAIVGQDCILETQNLHVLSLVMTASLVFFFVSRVPERLAPGLFDTVGQSHQLFHICGVIASTLHMYTFPIDAVARRSVMAADPNRLPDINSTLLLYAVVNVFCLVSVVVMSLMVKRKPPSETRKGK